MLNYGKILKNLYEFLVDGKPEVHQGSQFEQDIFTAAKNELAAVCDDNIDYRPTFRRCYDFLKMYIEDIGSKPEEVWYSISRVMHKTSTMSRFEIELLVICIEELERIYKEKYYEND